MNKMEWIAACVVILVAFLFGVRIGGEVGADRVEKFFEYVPQFIRDMLATVTAGSAIAYITLRINRRTEARELETRRRGALNGLAGTMFEYRELLMNTSYPVYLEKNGINKLIDQWFGKYEVTIRFGDGHYDNKTKDVLYIHHVFVKKRKKEVLRFSFRGEYELERNSVIIHVMPGQMSSTSRRWDNAITALDNVVGGLIVSDGVAGIGKPLVEKGYRKIVRGTVPMASDIDRRLKKAVETLNITEVEKTINDVTSINARDLRGKTFLLCAVVHGGNRVERETPPEDHKSSDITKKDRIDAIGAASTHCEIIRKIIEAGCDIDAEDNNGISPIIAAINIQNEMALRVIVEKRASMDLSLDVNGLNAIRLAASVCWSTGLKIIIEHSEDGHFKCEDYTESLHLALKKCIDRQSAYGNCSLEDRYIETVRVLLEAGACIDAHTDDGKSARDIIIQMNNETFVSLAEKYTS